MLRQNCIKSSKIRVVRLSLKISSVPKYSTKQLANQMYVSINTIKTDIYYLHQKLGTNSQDGRSYLFYGYCKAKDISTYNNNDKSQCETLIIPYS